MATFSYKAKTNTGETVTGALTAESQQAALRMLDDRALFPISVREGGRSGRAAITGRAKKLKMRTAGDDGELFDRMGVSVVFLPGGEVYEGLSRGVIDACQLSTPSVDWSLAIYEVCDYMYLSPVRQPMDSNPTVLNENSWEKLPADLQGLVKTVVDSEAILYYGQCLVNDLEAIQNFKDYGTNVLPASKEIEDELVRQAAIFYDEQAAADPFYAKVWNSRQAWKSMLREGWPRL